MSLHFKITDYDTPQKAFQRARDIALLDNDIVTVELTNGGTVVVTLDDDVDTCAAKYQAVLRQTPMAP